MTSRATRVREGAARGFRAPARRLGAAAVVSLVVMPSGTVAAWAAVPSPAATERAYALRIGIDDGHSSVRQGDRLTYTTKVSNTGSAGSPPLVLTQTLTPGLKLLSSTPKGKVFPDRIAWNRTLAAGKTDQFSVTVEVGRLPAKLERLAAVACASARSDKRPIVCASHLDRLPGSSPETLQGPIPGLVSGRGLWFAVAGAAAVLTASLGLAVRRRRTRPRT
ncbi:DUF11 domain-containing protein [Sphaerisporangium corydalis]|uniref:DUF11 domain-containing protein n=1 Tax=Sphaerisporangium corydalis TaxID=1441875 RepID=A0ABV9ELD4_9ACTN|nr:DUF11 domain-containing protein [Sphaerisporangium corydalis]